jgi:hypothetical protein
MEGNLRLAWIRGTYLVKVRFRPEQVLPGFFGKVSYAATVAIPEKKKGDPKAADPFMQLKKIL